MTQLAWIFLLLAWSIIIACTAYCFFKLLSSKRGLEDE